MDFVRDFAAWLPLVIIGDALGVEPADHPTLLKWSDDLMRGQGSTDEHRINEMVAAFAGYTAFADDAIDPGAAAHATTSSASSSTPRSTATS